MSYLKKNFRLRLDLLLGLRGLGLVTYGMIPASLVYLGVVKIDQNQLPTSIGTLELLALFIVFALPTLIMFRLVNTKVNRYYLLGNHSTIRSSILTFEIYIGSILICLATGVLSNKYSLTWNIIDLYKPLLDAFIGATASLAVSSTLISSVLINKVDLPGMPSGTFEAKIADFKEALSLLTKGEKGLKWGVEPSKKFFDDYVNNIREIRECTYFLSGQIHSKGGFDIFLKQILDDLVVLENAIEDIKFGANWEKYFSYNSKVFTDNKTMNKAKQIERFLNSKWITL